MDENDEFKGTKGTTMGELLFNFPLGSIRT